MSNGGLPTVRPTRYAHELEPTFCNLCGSVDSRLLYRSKDHRLNLDDKVWSIVRCRRCRFGYLNPRPTINSIAQYYPAEYFVDRGTSAAQRRYDAELKYLPQPPGRLLDIGTAAGDFVIRASQSGWDAVGLEPSLDTVTTDGANVVRARFPGDAPFAANTFDVITAWAVFEHLHDPMSAFRECSRLLKSTGVLVVQVPNLVSIHGRFSKMEDVPRHIHFFSPRTLASYGRASGLALERVYHTTDLFGGSGRGTLRLWLIRLLGQSEDDFFRLLSMNRRDRLRSAPALSIPWAIIAGLERLIFADWLVRHLRVSGQVVAIFRVAHLPK